MCKRVKTDKLKFKIKCVSKGCWYIYEKTINKYLCCNRNNVIFINWSTCWNKLIHKKLVDAPGYYPSRSMARMVVDRVYEQKTIKD